MPKNSTSTSTQRSQEPQPVGAANPTATTGPTGTEPLNQGTANPGIVDQAKQTVTQVASQAGDKVTSRINQQKDRTAEGLTSVVEAVRQVSGQLQEKDQNAIIPQYLNTAVDQVERLSNYVRSTDVRQMVTQFEQFARRQPAVFLGGAFALGLLAARFLKSSGEQTTPQSSSNTGINTPGQSASPSYMPSIHTGGTATNVPSITSSTGNREGS